MEALFAQDIFQLGGQVVTTALFIWYLYQRNGKQDRANAANVAAQNELNRNIERQTRVLISISKAHGLQGDAEELMRS